MKTIHSTTAIVLIAALAWTSQWAFAQSEEDEAALEEIIVTGSRVLGLGESTSPVVTVGQAGLEENPALTLADFLVENITANNGQLTLVDESNQSGRIAGDRSTGINLWSLGEENTLTLLNGSRLVNSAAPSGQGWFNVDANSILPGIAMQRADILLDGGSAIYGTDAVAGVVNFIPRYGFEGVEFRLQSDFYPDSIGSTGSAAFEGLYGTSFDDQRGALLVAFDYRDTDENRAAELRLNHADVPQYDGSETIAQYEADLYAGGRANDYFLARGSRGGTLLPDPLCGADEQLDAPYYLLGEIVPPGATSRANSGSCAGYPLPDTDGRDSDRYTVFTAVSYDFSDTVTASAEMGYSERQIFDPNRYDPNDGAYIGTPIQAFFPDNHPGVIYNREISPAWAMAAARGLRVRGGIAQFPIGFEDFSGYDASTYNVRAGLDIQLSRTFELQVGVIHGVSEASQARMIMHRANYLNAVNGLGGPDCDPATGTPGVGGCEFFNPFLSSALPDADSRGLANSPQVIAWLADPTLAVQHYKTTLTAADVLLNIDAGWELVGGPVGLVVGADYRVEEASQAFSDAYLAGGVLAGLNDPAVPFSGDEGAASVFAEMGLPFTDMLTMQLAVRYDHYDSVGGSVNPKIGLNFAPTDRVRLRASYGQSLKAPTIMHTNDTIGSANIPTGTRGGRRGGHRVSTIISGDPDIVPQTAVHISVGGDFTLAQDRGALRRLDLSASYVTFDFDDRIVLLQELDRMADVPGTGICGVTGAGGGYTEFFQVGSDGLPCFEGVDRNGDGILEQTELTHAYRSYTNLARAELEGIDLRLAAALDTPAGTMNLQLGGTSTLNYIIQDNPLEPPVDAVARSRVLAAIAANVPEWQMVGGLSMRWAGGAHSTGVTGRYKSQIYDSAGELTLGSLATWDLRHSWDIMDSLNLSFTARNIFDATPYRSSTNVPVRDGVTSYYLNLSLLLGQ